MKNAYPANTLLKDKIFHRAWNGPMCRKEPKVSPYPAWILTRLPVPGSIGCCTTSRQEPAVWMRIFLSQKNLKTEPCRVPAGVWIPLAVLAITDPAHHWATATTATFFVFTLWTRNHFRCRPTPHGFKLKRLFRVMSWGRRNTWAPIPDKLT